LVGFRHSDHTEEYKDIFLDSCRTVINIVEYTLASVMYLCLLSK